MAKKKRTSKKKAYYAGLDIGGTTIKAMLVDSAGKQVGNIVEVRSLAGKGHRKTFGQLKKALASLCKNAKITEKAVGAIGLDVPAPCSDGVIWDKANMAADWLGVNVRDTFAKASEILTGGTPLRSVDFSDRELEHLKPLFLISKGSSIRRKHRRNCRR